MKQKKLNLRTIAMTALAVTVTCCLATEVFAQDKPNGKPWPAPADAIAKKSTVKGSDAIKEGKELYIQHCKSCHGTKGQGDGSKSDKLDITPGDFTSAASAKVSEGEMYWKTTQGRKPMPSFKDKLTDNERWSVVLYVKTLK